MIQLHQVKFNRNCNCEYAKVRSIKKLYIFNNFNLQDSLLCLPSGFVTRVKESSFLEFVASFGGSGGRKEWNTRFARVSPPDGSWVGLPPFLDRGGTDARHSFRYSRRVFA